MNEESVKIYRDLKNTIDTAERKGEIKGVIKGKQMGERNKSLEIARNLKSMDIPSAQIAEATGLSIAEIDQL